MNWNSNFLTHQKCLRKIIRVTETLILSSCFLSSKANVRSLLMYEDIRGGGGRDESLHSVWWKELKSKHYFLRKSLFSNTCDLFIYLFLIQHSLPFCKKENYCRLLTIFHCFVKNYLIFKKYFNLKIIIFVRLKMSSMWNKICI